MFILENEHNCPKYEPHLSYIRLETQQTNIVIYIDELKLHQILLYWFKECGNYNLNKFFTTQIVVTRDGSM